MKRTILLCVLAFCACKKHETVQQSAAVDSAATVAATAPSVTVEPIASVAPSASESAIASASATAHEPTAAEIEAQKQAAKLRALEEAKEYGMIGLLNASPIDAGPGGVGTGTIGLGNIGTIGTGTRYPTGRVVHTPSIRQGSVQVNGRLPPEVIQRIVRQNFGRFRLCYENGLRANPSLQGRVATKYIIDRDGSVKTTQDNGSDIPDQNVVQCVVRAFGNLSYPQPEGGIVTVTFPLIFSPGS